MQGNSVVVIGGGPGGLLAAAHFARMGAHVTVYERNTLGEQTRLPLGWTIGLGAIARKSIEEAGISVRCLPTACASIFCSYSKKECLKTLFYTGSSDPKFGGNWVEKAIEARRATFKMPLLNEFFATHQMITQHLRQQIQDNLAENVKFCDGMMLVGGDLPKGEVIMEAAQAYSVLESDSPEASARVTVQADIVIGADGAGSKTRRLLQELDPELTSERVNSHVKYLTFHLSWPEEVNMRDQILTATPSGKPFLLKPTDSDIDPAAGAFVSFQLPAKENPDSAVRLMALYFQEGGRIGTGLLSCSNAWWEQKHSKDQVAEALKGAFPQIPSSWLEDCAISCMERNECDLRKSSFVTCSKLGSGRCVLIGDAAHAVSPNIGAGATNAMHDAALLGSCALDLAILPSPMRFSQSLSSSKSLEDAIPESPAESSTETIPACFDRFSTLAEEWTRLRLADAHALAKISQSLSDSFYWSIHKDWYLYLRSLPIVLPWALASMPCTWWLVPFSPQVALVKGGARPAEIQQTLHRAFYKVVAVAGVACAVTAGTAVQLLRSRRS